MLATGLLQAKMLCFAQLSYSNCSSQIGFEKVYGPIGKNVPTGVW